MDFGEFWEKLRHLEEFKPELTDTNKISMMNMIMIWEDDDYSHPVWFETLSENKLFGVS